MQTDFSRTTIALDARPSQAGDYCLLLEPSDPLEIAALRQRQNELQARLGGYIVEPVHLTCQRFELRNERYLEILLDRLFAVRSQLQYCPLTAVATVPLYSQFRNMHILKWSIQRSERLVQLSAQLEAVVNTQGIVPLYPPGWVSLLVTALEGIEGTVVNHRTQPLSALYHLFTPGFVSVSRLSSVNSGEFDFELIARFRLSTA